MNNRLTAAHRVHLGRVKQLPCSVCDTPGPSEAHHVKQGQQYSCVALCIDCHRGPHSGLHGGRAMWRLKKMDEIDALAVTVQRLLEMA